MKHLKTRFLALCGFMVLSAASLAPLVTQADGCPSVTVECGGKIRNCAGTQNGDKCDYSKSCLTCGGGNEFEILDGPVG